MTEQSKPLIQLQKERSDAQDAYLRAVAEGNLPFAVLKILSDDVLAAENAARLAEVEEWNRLHPDFPMDPSVGMNLL